MLFLSGHSRFHSLFHITISLLFQNKSFHFSIMTCFIIHGSQSRCKGSLLDVCIIFPPFVSHSCRPRRYALCRQSHRTHPAYSFEYGSPAGKRNRLRQMRCRRICALNLSCCTIARKIAGFDEIKFICIKDEN